MPEYRSTAEILADAFSRHGVQRIFGVPGGGSSLDLIEACRRRGVDFILARTENAAAIMASVTGELTQTFGVAVTTQGPGTASAVNGVAYAALDRAALLIISDGWTEAQATFDTHQAMDQGALLGPLVKTHTRLDDDDPVNEVEHLIQTVSAPPRGPAYIELTGEQARAPRKVSALIADKPGVEAALADSLQAAQQLLSAARRPVALIGLECRDPEISKRVRQLTERLSCPALTTYKAKGVVSDLGPNIVGCFTGGAVEQTVLKGSDLILLLGFDPVELIGRPWPYSAPVLDVGSTKFPVHYVKPRAGVYGNMKLSLEGLIDGYSGQVLWTPTEITEHRNAIRVAMTYRGNGEGLSPQDVVLEAAAKTATIERPQVTVDAGAHMFSAMAFWPANRPDDVLISNGLATMAFALPAAIAAALHEPTRQVIAFTGDGGLMMCIGELLTAVQNRCKLCVVVFNDSALSLIDIKQRARQLPRKGVAWASPDFATIARGFGLEAFSARSLEDYRNALDYALGHSGPTLIDVAIDASGYGAQAKALRG